jgi:hypothetical protein
MSIRELLSVVFGTVLLSALAPLSNAQMTADAAHDLALKTVRSRSHLSADQFLDIQRNGHLEESLATATIGWRDAPVLIYEVSETGVEIKENSIIYHIMTDADPTFIVAISSGDGVVYCIHGCGLRESLVEFQGLITSMKVRVSDPYQAESFADFYRQVNPQNYEDSEPLASLLELKQAAERQCLAGAKSFDAGESVFNAWWKHAESLYAVLPFEEQAFPQGNGYKVEWIVASAPSRKSCGGVALRAELEVSSDGRVFELTFASVENR